MRIAHNVSIGRDAQSWSGLLDIFRNAGERGERGPRVFIGKALHVASQYELSSIARPVAVTRHGATVGYFIPARAGHPDLDRAALKRLKAGEANRAANFTTGFQEFAAPACP